MTISRIDEFKAAGLNGLRAAKDRHVTGRDSMERSHSLSLVGAVIKYHGNRQPTFQYERGECNHPEGPFHDCIYVNVRNAQIPRAMQLAGGTDVVIDEKSHAQRFCEAMSELCGTPGWTK